MCDRFGDDGLEEYLDQQERIADEKLRKEHEKNPPYNPLPENNGADDGWGEASPGHCDWPGM